MELEKGRIPGHQLIFLVASFLIGATSLIFPGRDAGHDIWLAFIIGFTESLIFVFIYTSLAKKFPGQTPVQFNDTLFGPYLGKIISVMQLWFLLHAASVTIRSFGDFFVTAELDNTPIIVILAFIALISASAVRNGVEVIGRCAPILLFFQVAGTLATTLLLQSKMKLTNFLPILDISLPVLLKASHEVSSIPFGQTVAFLMVIPFLNQTKNERGYIISGMVIGCAVMLMAVLRNISVLGIVGEIEVYPTLRAVRLIDVAEVFTRLEILFVIDLLFMGFLKISTFYYGVVLGTAQLFKLKSYLPLVYPIGIIIVVLSLINFENIIEPAYFIPNTYPYYSMIFELFIPLLSLLLALIKGQKAGSVKKAAPADENGPQK